MEKQLDVIKKNGIHTLQLTNEQKSEIDAVFSELFDRSSIANDREMYSFVARMAINLCRIMSEVAVLRALEHPNPYSLQISSSSPFTPDKSIPSDNRKDGIVTRWNVSISAEDFHAVLNLAEPLYCHAMHILSFLPNTEVSHRPNADRDSSSSNWVRNLPARSCWKSNSSGYQQKHRHHLAETSHPTRQANQCRRQRKLRACVCV